MQVRRRESEQEEQDSSHEEDEVEQDVLAVGGEVRHGSGQETGDSPQRHGGGGAEAGVAEPQPREAEAEPKMTRLAGFEGEIVVVGRDGGSVVLLGCDLGDRFPQLGVFGEQKGGSPNGESRATARQRTKRFGPDMFHGQAFHIGLENRPKPKGRFHKMGL